MEEPTVLGLPLNIDLGDADESVTPLSALVVLKGVDNSGNEVYTVAFTDGVPAVEGLAFANFARLFCEFQLRKTFYDISG